MKLRNLGLFFLCVLLFSTQAYAQNIGSGTYLGFAVGRTSSMLAKTDFSTEPKVDDENYGGKLFAGYKFNQFFGIEGSYNFYGPIKVKLGEQESTLRIRALSMDAVLILPIMNRFSIFGKLGVFRDDKDFSNTLKNEFGYRHSTGNEYGFDFGVGLQYDFENNLGLRAEWHQLDNKNIDNSMLSLGILYTFPPY